jgi:hypothetical protein
MYQVYTITDNSFINNDDFPWFKSVVKNEINGLIYFIIECLVDGEYIFIRNDLCNSFNCFEDILSDVYIIKTKKYSKSDQFYMYPSNYTISIYKKF